MGIYNETFGTIVGRVRSDRKGCSEEQAKGWINDAVREVLGRRAYWPALKTEGILSLAAQVTDGTVSVATNSRIVTGSGTGWPVSDVVNTTIAAGVPVAGYQLIKPASMQGICDGQLLLIDAAGTPEVVGVIESQPNAFWAECRYTHSASCTVQASSLAGRHFRVGSSYPRFMVIAVSSATQLYIESPWGGPALSGVTYQILQCYVPILPHIRRLDSALDQQQGTALETQRYTKSKVDRDDPQRTDQGDPCAIFPTRPNCAGIMQFEVWPAPVTARQISWTAYKDWPRMENINDRFPWFLNPTMFYHYAMASALSVRLAKEDFGHSLNASVWHKGRGDELYLTAMNEAEELDVQELTTNEDRLQRTAFYYQSHEPGFNGPPE